MEFLFLLFVLYMIFSAIGRMLRSAAGQEKYSPSPLQAPPRRKRVQKSDLTLETDTWLPLETAELQSRDEYPVSLESLQQTVIDKGPEKMSKQVYKEEPRKEISSYATRLQRYESIRATRKKVVKETITSPKLDPGLLLQGRNLPLAVIAAEVLAVPRSKRPHFQLRAGRRYTVSHH